MEITDVKVVLKEGPDKKLKAYATLTFDNCFVVRNVKVIQGNRGFFVAMPSRKLRQTCPKCKRKNPVGSRYCNHCGTSLPQSNIPHTLSSPSSHRDIAHPITPECRTYIQKRVLDAYEEELKKTVSSGATPVKRAEPTEGPKEDSGQNAQPEEMPKPEEPDKEDTGDIEL